MFKKRIGEAFTIGLTALAVLAGITVANSLVSTPASATGDTNPLHNGTNPFHSGTNPYHHQKPPPPVPPLFGTAFRCNSERSFNLISQWVTNGQIGIYDFFGDCVPPCFYGCTDAGIALHLTNSTTTLSSISYELNEASNCNNSIGPDVFINFNTGSGAATNRVVCSSSFFTGIDSSTGYAMYTIPESAFETGYNGIDTPYVAGDTLNQVSLVFFPGQSSQGTVKVINVNLNGTSVVPVFGITAGCQDYVQTELQANGFSCPNSCQ